MYRTDGGQFKYVNKALAEWYWQAKTEVPREKPCPPQILHGLAWDWTNLSKVRRRPLIAWVMARRGRKLADLLGGNKKKKNKKIVVSLRANIWTRHIPIMNQAYQTLNHNILY